MSSCLSKASAKGHQDGRLPYQYQSLDRPGKEIRVLEVLPGNKEDPLRASFFSLFLSEDRIEPYETISYAWGDPNQRGEIQIDESIIDIPASSGAALRCMRWPDKSRRLWIDAVCIKQGDDQERSFQVKMMGEVYRRSSHNLVYLGEEDASTKSAMASIERALEELNTKLSPSTSFTKLIRRGGPRLKCELDLAALFHFFKRPWFRRMWVVQEVVFAPLSTCYCGAEICIDLVSLIRAASYINLFHASKGNGPLGGVSDIASEITSSFYPCVQLRPFVDPNIYNYQSCVRPNKDRSKISRNLHKFVRLSDTRLCTDPRDTIFSIVGLIEQAGAKTTREDGADLALLEVDYGKCFKDVLRDAIRFCIQESRSLEVWHGRLRHPNSSVETGDILLDGFCSWVPRTDLSRAHRDRNPLWTGLRASAGLRVRRQPAMVATLDPNVLTLDGYDVTDVIEVTQPLEKGLFRHEARLADTLISMHCMCRGVITPASTRPNGFPECLARTLTLSPYQGVKRHDDIYLSLQKHVCNVFDSGSKNNESEYWSEEAKAMFLASCQNRRVFTGSNGYIGQGPSCLQAGDRIVVLLGGKVPYAVRPLPGGGGDSGERYHLLGSVYVYGVMYGEFVEAAVACGKEPSIFHLV